MKWHEQHRARMAARTLARHRKATERAPIIAKAASMYAERGLPIPDVLMGRLDLAAKLEGVSRG